MNRNIPVIEYVQGDIIYLWTYSFSKDCKTEFLVKGRFEKTSQYDLIKNVFIICVDAQTIIWPIKSPFAKLVAVGYQTWSLSEQNIKTNQLIHKLGLELYLHNLDLLNI